MSTTLDRAATCCCTPAAVNLHPFLPASAGAAARCCIQYSFLPVLRAPAGAAAAVDRTTPSFPQDVPSTRTQPACTWDTAAVHTPSFRPCVHQPLPVSLQPQLLCACCTPAPRQCAHQLNPAALHMPHGGMTGSYACTSTGPVAVHLLP